MKKLFILFSFFLFVGVLNAHCEDFSVLNSYNKVIYYKITSSVGNFAVEVSYRGNNSIEFEDEYSGSIVIPSTVSYGGVTYNVNSIGEGAFYGCSITYVSIPSSVNIIRSAAFAGCLNLYSISLPKSIRLIGESAFSYSNIGSISIPEGVNVISGYCFTGCSNLDAVVIPSSVNLIGENAFAECSDLNSITCKATVPPTTFSNSFFAMNNNAVVFVPCSSLSDYQNSQYWNSFSNFQCLIGLNDIKGNVFEANLYPNPASDRTKMMFEGFSSGSDVLVYDFMGRLIRSFKINDNQKEFEINLNGFSSGVYYFRIANKDFYISKELVVVK